MPLARACLIKKVKCEQIQIILVILINLLDLLLSFIMILYIQITYSKYMQL